MPRPSLALAAVVAALAGCGGDEPAAESGGPPVTVPAGREVRVAGDEYSFTPAKVVVAGTKGPVKVTLDNRGSLAHNLKLFAGERELGGTPTFTGGESRSGSVRLPPGRYRMVCTVGNHEELGMTGTLEVR